MPNPFDDESADFLVLTNDDLQHSLWPARFAVPEGWNVAFGADARSACLEYVEANWPDLRPARLTDAPV